MCGLLWMVMKTSSFLNRGMIFGPKLYSSFTLLMFARRSLTMSMIRKYSLSLTKLLEGIEGRLRSNSCPVFKLEKKISTKIVISDALIITDTHKNKKKQFCNLFFCWTLTFPLHTIATKPFLRQMNLCRSSEDLA